MKWRWLREDLFYVIHDRQIAEHGGLSGVRDAVMLESALARPRNRVAYGRRLDAAELAAAYAFGIVRNHPFVDGNKHVGFALALVFILDNGYRINFDPIDAVHTVEKLAAGSLSEKAFARWLRAGITKRKQPKKSA